MPRKKSRHGFQKLFRGVHVNPVAGMGNCDERRLRKHFFDKREIVLREILGSSAENEARGLCESKFGLNRLRQLRVIGGNRFEIDSPAKTMLSFAGQIFYQEAPDLGGRNFRDERGVNLSKGFKRAKVKFSERSHHALVAGWITLRGDINDNQFVYIVRLGRGRLHGHFAAHGMAEEVHRREFLLNEKVKDIFGHSLVAHTGMVR